MENEEGMLQNNNDIFGQMQSGEMELGLHDIAEGNHSVPQDMESQGVAALAIDETEKTPAPTDDRAEEAAVVTVAMDSGAEVAATPLEQMPMPTPASNTAKAEDEVTAVGVLVTVGFEAEGPATP